MNLAGYVGSRIGSAIRARLMEQTRQPQRPLRLVGPAPEPPDPPQEAPVFRPVLLTRAAAGGIDAFMERFCHYRADHARQWRGVDRQTGEVTYGWARVGKQQPDDCALTPAVVAGHLRGEITVGTYLLDAENTCRLVVLDHDDKRILPEIDPGTGKPRVIAEDGLRHLQDCRERLRQQGIDCAVSESRRGGHLFIFLDEAVPARDARALTMLALGEEEVERMALGHQAFEIYPKQDRASGVGSNIALPLGVHLKDSQRHPFVDAYGDAVASTLRGQLAYVGEVGRCRVREVVRVRPWLYEDLDRAMHPARPREPLERAVRQDRSPGRREFQRFEPGRPSMIARWKAGVDVRDVVASYGITLDAHGSGHCPFHDDQHASFAAYEDRWYCFAEGRGGDALSFIAEMENLAPKEALALARERFPVPGLELTESQPSGRA